jgi:hypothetical protein
MADKSPRHSLSKKSGKSIKEKRLERKAKTDTPSQMERLTRDKKHWVLADTSTCAAPQV